MIISTPPGANKDLSNLNDLGTAGQVLTSNGAGAAPTFQAAGGGGVTVTTLLPLPNHPRPIGVGANICATNTTAHYVMISVPFTIVVNKLSIDTNNTAIGTATTFDIGVYSADGQTRYINITTANVAATDTVYSTAVSSVSLSPGIYYVVIIANTNGFDGGLSVWTQPASGAGAKLLDVASEPVLAGTSTETAGVLPATFNPVSGITVSSSSATSGPIIRLDT